MRPAFIRSTHASLGVIRMAWFCCEFIISFQNSKLYTMPLVNLRFRRAAREVSAGDASPSIPLKISSLSSLTWPKLAQELRILLGLGAEGLDVSHLVLIDAEGDEASGAISDIAKLTKFYNLRYDEDSTCFFAVHTKPLIVGVHTPLPTPSPPITPKSAPVSNPITTETEMKHNTPETVEKLPKESLALDSPNETIAERQTKPLQRSPATEDEGTVKSSPDKLTSLRCSLYSAPSDAYGSHIVYLPQRAKWETIEAALKDALPSALPADFQLQRFDLIDGQGEDIASNLTTAQKFWTTLSLRYKRDSSMCFVINKGMAPQNRITPSPSPAPVSKSTSFSSPVLSPVLPNETANATIAEDSSPERMMTPTTEMETLMESILDKCEILQETIRRSVSRSRSDSLGLEFEGSESDDALAKKTSPGGPKSRKVGSLLTKQASIDKPLQDLIHACGNGSLPDVLALIRQGAMIHGCDPDGFTPLHVAAMRGQLEIVHYILTAAANTDKGNAHSSSGSPVPLHISEAPRSVFTASQLCGLRDRFQMTALHYACENGHLFVAEQLLKHGADICARNSSGTTPLHIICLCGASDLLGLIPESLVNCATYDGLSLLHCAADQGHIDICAYLIHLPGVVIASRDDAGMTPLHYACISGHIAIVQLLIEHGAYWNCRDDRGRTPLLLAARHGHTFVVDWLVARGANVNSRDDAGATALHHACVSGALATVKKLVEHRIDVNCRTKKGATPAEVASAADHEDIVAWLEDHGGHMRPELEGQAELRVQIESATELAARAWEDEEQILHAEACMKCRCKSSRVTSPTSKVPGRVPQFKSTPNRTREKIPFSKTY